LQVRVHKPSAIFRERFLAEIPGRPTVHPGSGKSGKRRIFYQAPP
jgi:hypothetical protein